MATALGGLVIIGVMIAGVFFTSNQELRVGTNTFVQERAFRAAEFGVNTSLASWDNSEMLLLAVGGQKEIVYDYASQGWRDTVTITRLNATTYLIGSTGTAFGGIQGSSRRRTALLVRLSVPAINAKGALVAAGESRIGGASIITGFDTDPLGWTSCPTSSAPLAAVAVEDDDDVDFVGCPGNKCLKGVPPLLESEAVADTAIYFDYGDESWTTLSKLATKAYAGSQTFSQIGPVLTAEGTCDANAAQNWGATSRSIPAQPCEDFFPIIHAGGASSTLKLTGGSGQGILLVDGNLEISGSFAFYGPVVVRGTVKATGAAAIKGALMVANMDSDEGEGEDEGGNENSFLGASAITYSSCTITKAFENALPPKRLIERAWMEVF